MSGDLLSLIQGRRGHFQLESRHHGDLWFQLETLCQRSREVRAFAAELAARLVPYKIDAVCGPLVEGAFVALLVSLELGCDFTYAERFANPSRQGLFPVEYHVPHSLHDAVRGRRVAIVNDVINAGSAVRGAFADLQALGANVVAMGTLLVLGDTFRTFAARHRVPLEALQQMPNNLWTPEECPLCQVGEPLESAPTS